jgi:hypothetical protein
MAKIDSNDTILAIGQLAELRNDGWISTETGEDALIAVGMNVPETAPGTGEVEITLPETGATATIEIEVARDGIVTLALRARCECGNPWALCHPEA